MDQVIWDWIPGLHLGIAAASFAGAAIVDDFITDRRVVGGVQIGRSPAPAMTGHRADTQAARVAAAPRLLDRSPTTNRDAPDRWG